MAITAMFKTKIGTKMWRVSPSCVLDIDGFSTSYELNAESNTAVEGSPLSNQRGMKKQPLSFSTHLSDALGIDVRQEFESWKEWVGLSGTLKFGGKKFGTKWLLTSVKPSEVYIDDLGRFRRMKLTYTFEENEDGKDAKIVSTASAVKSAAAVTATTEQKSNKKADNKAVTSSAKTAAASSEIALGDFVQFKGGPHYSSSTATSYRISPKPGRAKVTAISKKAPHPYHVIHTDKTTTVYGWVDASQISK